MNNLFNISEEEKNRIRGLHLVESNNKKISSILVEQDEVTIVTINCVEEGCVDPGDGTGKFTGETAMADCEAVCGAYNEKIKDLTEKGFILADETYVAEDGDKVEEVITPNGVTVKYYSRAIEVDDAGGDDTETATQQVKNFKEKATQKFNEITQPLVGDLLNIYTSKNTRDKKQVDKKGFLGIGRGGLVTQLTIKAGGVAPTWKINPRQRNLSTITGFKFSVVDKRRPKDLTKKSMCIPKQIIYKFTKENKAGMIRFACDTSEKLWVSAMSNGVDQWNPVMQELYKASQWFNKQTLLPPNTDQ